MRHALTKKSPVDRNRQLSREGDKQARKLAKQWTHDHFLPTLVLASPTPRTVRTAKIATGNLPVQTYEELYLGTDPEITAIITAISKQIGSGSLRLYLASPEGHAIIQCAKAAVKVILRKIRAHKPKKVAIFGHEILIAAIGYVLSGQTRDDLLDLIIGECTGFEIELRL